MDRRLSGWLAKLVPWMVAIFLVIMGQVFDLPLISAQIAGGYFASGDFAAGVFSAGLFTAGFVAAGGFAIGFHSTGIFSFGVFSAGVFSSYPGFPRLSRFPQPCDSVGCLEL